MIWPALVTDETVENLLAKNSPVALSLSGGIDGETAAAHVYYNLRERGYSGPIFGIHSHLGRIEHLDSQPQCQRFCDHLGIELVIVEREKGDMVDRWLQRWNDNLTRFVELLCVKLILPWSTASMRFCTSELKSSIICRYLINRFMQLDILNVLGIRWDESPNRAKSPVCAPQPKLFSKTLGTTGYTWNPILPWKKEQCFAYHKAHSLPIHGAYAEGFSRVSCVFCILARFADLVVATTNPAYHDLYRELVSLEIISAFSFQPDQWLGDIAPWLLMEQMRADLADAKRKATLRNAIEQRIPKHLLYTRNWPTIVPTFEEAALLAEIRGEIAALYNLTVKYTTPDMVRDRYSELLEEKVRRDQEKERAAERAAKRLLVVA